MTRPHPALLDLAADRPLPLVDDLGELARSAIEHRIDGLLWTRVANGQVYGPGAWTSMLAARDLLARRSQERMWDVVARVQAELGGLGVEVALLKGLSVQQRWYARPGERRFDDVDLLVAPHHLSRADEIVEHLFPGHPLSRQAVELVATGGLQSVQFTREGVTVDLHFDLFKIGLPTRNELLWEHTVELLGPGGREVVVLNAGLSLLHLLVHLNKDRFRFLGAMADVARIVSAEHIGSGVWRLARHQGLEVAAQLAGEAVTKTLSIPSLPGPVPRVRPRAIVWRAVWRPSIRLHGADAVRRFRWRQGWISLLAERQVSERLVWLRRRVFPPRVLTDRYRAGRGPRAWRILVGGVNGSQGRRDPARPGREVLDPALAGSRTPPETVARLLRGEPAQPRVVTARGSSMGRSVRSGTSVRIVSARAPRWGEVWAFCDEASNIVVHRCRGRAGGQYRFQGDAVLHADPLVRPELLVGRVTAMSRGGRSRGGRSRGRRWQRVGWRSRWARALLVVARHQARRLIWPPWRALRRRLVRVPSGTSTP